MQLGNDILTVVIRSELCSRACCVEDMLRVMKICYVHLVGSYCVVMHIWSVKLLPGQLAVRYGV